MIKSMKVKDVLIKMLGKQVQRVPIFGYESTP